jgi:hypothetical protein
MKGDRMEKIIELLKRKLANIYCDSCQFEGSENRCDECKRKSMMWKPSDDFLSILAKEIQELQ